MKPLELEPGMNPIALAAWLEVHIKKHGHISVADWNAAIDFAKRNTSKEQA